MRKSTFAEGQIIAAVQEHTGGHWRRRLPAAGDRGESTRRRRELTLNPGAC